MLVDINLLILRVLDADRDLRSQARNSPAALLGISGNKPQPVLLASSYMCPNLDDGAKLDLWEPAGPEQSPGKDDTFDHLFIFWSNCFFKHVAEGEQGSSWIELFAFFQSLGGLLYPSEQAVQHHRSFKTQLSFFISSSKALFAAQGSTSTSELFKPNRAPGYRLEKYGLCFRVPCVNVLLCMYPEAAQVMHTQLLTLKVPGKKKTHHSDRPYRALKLPANCPWAHLCTRQNIPEILQRRIQRKLECPTTCAEGVGHFHPTPGSFLLRCPRSHCKQIKCAAKTTLIKGTSWCQLKCPHCKRSSSAAKWLCACNIPWHQCPEHRQNGFACGSKALYQKKTCPSAAVSQNNGLGENIPTPAQMYRYKRLKLGERVAGFSVKVGSASRKATHSDVSKTVKGLIEKHVHDGIHSLHSAVLSQDDIAVNPCHAPLKSCSSENTQKHASASSSTSQKRNPVAKRSAPTHVNPDVPRSKAPKLSTSEAALADLLDLSRSGLAIKLPPEPFHRSATTLHTAATSLAAAPGATTPDSAIVAAAITTKPLATAADSPGFAAAVTAIPPASALEPPVVAVADTAIRLAPDAANAVLAATDTTPPPAMALNTPHSVPAVTTVPPVATAPLEGNAAPPSSITARISANDPRASTPAHANAPPLGNAAPPKETRLVSGTVSQHVYVAISGHPPDAASLAAAGSSLASSSFSALDKKRKLELACVRQHGMCPKIWTIHEYCPFCHG